MVPLASNRTIPPSSDLINGNYLVVDDAAETVGFRAYIARAGGHPIQYPYSELWPHILDEFYKWTFKLFGSLKGI
jgi:hypothetical protein